MMAAAGIGCKAPVGTACPALHGEGEKSCWAREEERKHVGYVGCAWLAAWVISRELLELVNCVYMQKLTRASMDMMIEAGAVKDERVGNPISSIKDHLSYNCIQQSVVV